MIIRKRLEGIDLEMQDFVNILKEFANTADYELEKFTNNFATLQKNLNQVHIVKNGTVEPEMIEVNQWYLFNII